MEELSLGSTEAVMKFINLPDEVLCRILSFISHNDLCCVARTCIRLNHIASQSYLWRNVKFLLHGSTAPFLPLYENLLRLGDHTRSVSMIGVRPGRLLHEGYAHMEEFYSSSDEECLVEVKFILDDCINISGKCYPISAEAEGPDRIHFDDFPKMLDTVKYNADKKWLRLQLLRKIARRCPEMRTLNLQNIRLLYEVPPILPEWNTLIRLSFRGSELCTNNVRNVGPLFDLSTRLPNLQYFDLGCCAWVNCLCLAPLSKFIRLQTLLLDGCFNFGCNQRYTSYCVAHGFRAIEHLDLRSTKFNDWDVFSLSSNTTIRKLLLGKYMRAHTGKEREGNFISHGEPGGSTDSQDRSRQLLTRRLPNQTSELNLNRSFFKGSRTRISPLKFGPDYILHESPYTENSTVPNIGALITDESILALGNHGLPGLTDLVLAGTAITDKSLVSMEGRVGLRSLDIRNTGVTEAGVKRFQEKCHDVVVYSDFTAV